MNAGEGIGLAVVWEYEQEAPITTETDDGCLAFPGATEGEPMEPTFRMSFGAQQEVDFTLNRMWSRMSRF